MTLAIDGGTPELATPLAPFRTIGAPELKNAMDVVRTGPLSGYLGGARHGGYWVRRLEVEWADAFYVKHAIACNSATSGLLAACAAAGVRPGTEVITTPYTMSATAAAPRLLGADVVFDDIELDTFCLARPNMRWPGVVIVTNLFGHPARLAELRGYCDQHNLILIEDNAQAPFAMEHGLYAGTIGHIGVFSLNVHKHIQCGEGGVIVTDDDNFADRLYRFVNHGELAGGDVGLNLRMTEVTAAIACAQLARKAQIMAGRKQIARELSRAVEGLPGLTAPSVREGCKHVYYCWALKIAGDRNWFVRAMQAEGVPLREGYVMPLYEMPAFHGHHGRFPATEEADRTLVLYENCAWDPTIDQRQLIANAFHKVVERKPALVL